MKKCPNCGQKNYAIINGYFKCNICGNIWKENMNDNKQVNNNMNNYMSKNTNYILRNHMNYNMYMNNNMNHNNIYLNNINKTNYNNKIHINNKDNNVINKNNKVSKISSTKKEKEEEEKSSKKKELEYECECCPEKEEEGNQFLINIKFFDLENTINYEKKNLTGLLNLCLVKYLSESIGDDNIILGKMPPDIRNIIIELRNSLNFTKDNQKNIYNLLNENKGNNIIVYSQYISKIMNSAIINNIISHLNNDKKIKIDNYWRCLSKYEEYTSFFEQELIKDLKNTSFDYSVVSLGIIDTKNEEKYKLKRNNCLNKEKRILYHGTQIDPISKILTSEFKYSRRPFYGMGIYFSDIIDYIPFYTGGKNFEDRRDKFGYIVPIGDVFSFIACEVFYDRNKFKEIKDDSLYVPDLDHFPSYEELKEKYRDKMIEPNGIHFIKVNSDGNVLSENPFLDEEKNGEFL
jgi:ribosomal protein L44E